MQSIKNIKEKLMPSVHVITVLKGLIGGTLSIFILLILTKFFNHLYIMAPFGASCVLLYAVPQSPLAQPKNIILGHFISAFIGLFFLKFFTLSAFTIALSVGCAIASMQLLRCVHPPAGANPLVILLTAQSVHYEWTFLLFPVLLGTVILVLIATVINNIKSDTQWPNHTFNFKIKRRRS
ncbi:HPP family protein [Acinetobacter sp. B5B]|uniref:HPP family protein n=1 Tax=Acinetobacter baretiae TaxID=2605383 RepID=UPI0018C280D0|nr:HPP family protein [Acinetobacter baretiae]MBF7681944.1 HPP family protein [Acinetobacter baretiae]MBF7685684.1 HPP family protein [Acinetobacter baretiae]